MADLEDLKKLEASDINPRRINPKENLIRQRADEFIFHLQMVQQNCQEDVENSENPL